MESFGVLYNSTTNKQLENLSSEVHVNFWKLPRGWNQYDRYVDFGIRINDQSSTVDSISVYCPFEIKDDLSELHSYISGLDNNYKYILQVSCPFDLKEDVKQELDNSNNVIASRLNVRADKTKKAEENVDIAVESNVDVKKSFIEFLDTTDLKYPKDLYLEVLGGI